MSPVLQRLKARALYWLSWAVVILPSWAKLPIYRAVFGYRIGKDVKIGMSWIHVGQLEIGDHVRIRGLNRFKNIPEVRIGDHTGIGRGNTFTSTREFTAPESLQRRGNRPALIIGRHCAVTLFHYFDIQDRITVGDYTTIAGLGSAFWTHYIDVENNTQSAKPIEIGAYCMVAAHVRFVAGTGVADRSVVALGSIVTKKFAAPFSFIGGNPARMIRTLPEDAAYFHRQRGWVGTFVMPPDNPQSRDHCGGGSSVPGADDEQIALHRGRRIG